MKKRYLLVMLPFLASVGAAQPRHSDSAEASQQMQQMHGQMQEMHSLMERARNTDDPQERQRLMDQCMAMMQSMMDQMMHHGAESRTGQTDGEQRQDEPR